MDIQMPEVDGIEATRFIVRNIPLARRPRVVAMSANVMREHVDAALAAGAAQYVGKPFAPSELRQALEQSIRVAPIATVGARSSGQKDASELLCSNRVRCHLEGDEKGEFLRDLTVNFEITAGDLLERLSAAVGRDDSGELRAVIHEYSGMCAVIGAEKLTQVLSELQKIAKSGSAKGAALLVEQCRSVLKDTIAALHAAVRQHSALASSDAPTGQHGTQSGRRSHKAR